MPQQSIPENARNVQLALPQDIDEAVSQQASDLMTELAERHSG